jgi:hypothetical protein
VRPILIAVCLIPLCAGPAQAQLFRRPAPPASPPVAAPPPGLAPEAEDMWPYPEPDPKTWWNDARPRIPEAADPLGGRRLPRGERLPVVANGVDASTYRLWGLTPLQWEVLYPGEMILEVWVRPATSVRQSVVRVVVRRDGRAFLEARAGLACCEADISRRLGFDVELAPGAAGPFLALRSHPMWEAPRLVRVRQSGTAEGVCVNGVGYDLTLAVPGRTRSLHRACEDEEIGQVADALEPVLRAALGHDPRFDVLYPGGIDFHLDRQAYRDLIAGGGSLRADPNARPEPPGAEPAPKPEAATPPAAAAAPGPAAPR